MFEIETYVDNVRRDAAEAETPAAAIAAGRQLVRDAVGSGVASTRIIVRAYLHGMMIWERQGSAL